MKQVWNCTNFILVIFFLLLPENEQFFSYFYLKMSTTSYIAVVFATRTVEPEPEQNQFCMAGARAKNFYMVEPKPEPEISILFQQP